MTQNESFKLIIKTVGDSFKIKTDYTQINKHFIYPVGKVNCFNSTKTCMPVKKKNKTKESSFQQTRSLVCLNVWQSAVNNRSFVSTLHIQSINQEWERDIAQVEASVPTQGSSATTQCHLSILLSSHEAHLGDHNDSQ